MRAMSEASSETLKSTLKACGLLDAAEEVGEGMYRMAWGSATVVCVTRGTAVVAMAPMFEALPKKDVGGFCQKILKLNAEMGGTAAFAIHADGSVVLQSGRGVAGLDPDELKLLLNTVGKFADDYDDILDKDYYQ